jgi:hypothetical protein
MKLCQSEIDVSLNIITHAIFISNMKGSSPIWSCRSVVLGLLLSILAVLGANLGSETRTNKVLLLLLLFEGGPWSYL